MLWKLRAIVYGGIAVVAALILIGLGGEDEPPFIDGRTSQGRGITVQLEDAGRSASGWASKATAEAVPERRFSSG